MIEDDRYKFIRIEYEEAEGSFHIYPENTIEPDEKSGNHELIIEKISQEQSFEFMVFLMKVAPPPITEKRKVPLWYANEVKEILNNFLLSPPEKTKSIKQ
jgi:hypothetical protein